MQTSVNELVNEITKVNHAWKTACELFEKEAPLSISLRDMKHKLQVQLLRNFYPQAFLAIDPAEAGTVYSLRLHESISNRHNAAHIPEQIARQLLFPQRPEDFLKR